MRDQQLQGMREFGCPESLVDFLSELPDECPFFAHQSGGEGLFWIAKAAPDCESAMYIDRSALLLALAPERARKLMAITGAKPAEGNPTTVRVKVTPEILESPGNRERFLSAAVEALHRSAGRAAKADSERSDRMYAPLGRTCPECKEELPLTGICDRDGRPEAVAPTEGADDGARMP